MLTRCFIQLRTTAGGKAQLPVPGSGGVFANAFVALQKNLPSGLVAQKP